MQQQSKAWIFVSHSIRDLEAVRRVRNHLEAKGGEPLLFFLKALEKDEELRVLLRREIAERRFFVLCDSANARASRWVQEEVKFVEGFNAAPDLPRSNRKRIARLNIDTDLEAQLPELDRLMTDATVFISYSRRDMPTLRPYIDMLIESDFGVGIDDPANILPGTDWRQYLNVAIRKSAENGWFLIFLSQASTSSDIVQHEVAAFLATGSTKIIPIALEPLPILPPALQNRQVLQFYGNDFQTNSAMLLRALGL